MNKSLAYDFGKNQLLCLITAGCSCFIFLWLWDDSLGVAAVWSQKWGIYWEYMGNLWWMVVISWGPSKSQKLKNLTLATQLTQYISVGSAAKRGEAQVESLDIASNTWTEHRGCQLGSEDHQLGTTKSMAPCWFMGPLLPPRFRGLMSTPDSSTIINPGLFNWGEPPQLIN